MVWSRPRILTPSSLDLPKVRLRSREVGLRKRRRSGTWAWYPALKLLKSLPMGSPSQDRDTGSNPVEATTHSFSETSATSAYSHAVPGCAVEFRGVDRNGLKSPETDTRVAPVLRRNRVHRARRRPVLSRPAEPEYARR